MSFHALVSETFPEYDHGAYDAQWGEYDEDIPVPSIESSSSYCVHQL